MLNSDFQKLSVTGRVTLYELDATKLGAGIFRWHGHMSYEDWQIIDGSMVTDSLQVRRPIVDAALTSRVNALEPKVIANTATIGDIGSVLDAINGVTV